MLNVKSHFTNFKIHTQYSICEGAIKIEELADYCKKNKIPAIGLSDSFNLCGALEFSEIISKAGTQPIIGTQINFKFSDTIGKVPIFAKTKLGYSNLVKLSSKSFLEYKDKEIPHCSIDELLTSKDIIVLSGGTESLFANLLKKNKINESKNLALKLKDAFSDSFYLEIQRHNEKDEKRLENLFLDLSKKIKIPLIASQEIFYINKDMYEAHDAFLCIGEKTYVDEKNRKKYSNQHYIKSSEEIQKLYTDIPEALENNFNFPYRFNYKLKKSSPVLPSLKISDNRSENQELLLQSKKGLKNRLDNFILKKNDTKNNKKIEKKYNERLLHELSIINKMNYSGYFLIVSDYIRWAKKNNIPVGPGRGSGAGSLAAYCLDITDLDPIEFGLIFERFLNPDRISMPDFDIDFCEEKRDLVFKYLKSKYKNGVAHIITFGKLKARMALRDIGRVLGLPYGHVDRICKMIPFDPSRPLSLKESIVREPRFKEEEKNNPKVKKLIELSLKLEGLNRNLATHAAGVVIAGEKLSEQVPLYKDNNSDLLLDIYRDEAPVKLLVESKLDYSEENLSIEELEESGFQLLSIGNNFTTHLITNKDEEDDCDVTILCYGRMLKKALKACYELFIEEEITSQIIIPSQIFPYNISPTKNFISQSKKIITIEEGYSEFGWGSYVVSEMINSNCFNFALKDISIMGPKFNPIPASIDAESKHFISSKDIYDKVQEMLND